jgi:hypothetical protein
VTVSPNADGVAVNVNLGLPVTSDNCSVASVTNDAPASFPVGTTLVTWTATDRNGNSASCEQQVIVRDTTPPQILSLVATPNLLWPPNHRMVQVHLKVKAVDNSDPSPVVRITQVTCNQPQDRTEPDCEITGAQSLNLRAERTAKLGDRIYTIFVEAKDSAGNTTTDTVSVSVR